MYAVLHPPEFAVQAAAHACPELRKRPFALLDGEPPSETVYAGSRSARTLGVEPGLTRLQAEAIPEVLLLPRRREHEDAAHMALHTVACAFSPRIEHVDTHPGTYALDIRGMDRLFGTDGQLAARLRESVRTVGYVAQVAVAQNFDAAVCLARGRKGISIVTLDEDGAALGSLPIRVLNLSPEHDATFRGWGIRTCGELAGLPEGDVIARLGQDGRRLHALARGVWPHLMLPFEPSFESALTERMELDHPVEILEQLLFLLSRLTEALLERVKARARSIATLRVVLNLEGGSRHIRMVRPALPLQDKATLLKLLQLDLETHPPCGAILSIELQAQSAAPWRAQHGLFLPQAPEPGRLEVLLARLRKLLGEQHVGSPELTDDHRPNAFRMAPFVPEPSATKDRLPLSVPTALRVCRPPEAIGVVLSGSAPAQVFLEGRKYSVQDTAGPWRVSGQWWSEENWCREEWDVRLSTSMEQKICRIAFDPRSRCWYMQGTYD